MIARGWVLDDLLEIEGDLSRFHRVDDMGGMDGRRFWRLVATLPAYAGALAAKRHNTQRQEAAPMVQAPQQQRQAALPAGVRVIGASAAELRSSDIGDVFSIGDARV